MNSPILIWLLMSISISVAIMLGMDILDAIVKYRNNKVEERRRQAEEEMAKAYKPPEIAITNPKIIPLKAKIDISGSLYIDPEGELAKLLAKEMIDKELLDIRVFEDPTTNRRRIEATLKVAKFDDDRDILD